MGVESHSFSVSPHRGKDDIVLSFTWGTRVLMTSLSVLIVTQGVIMISFSVLSGAQGAMMTSLSVLIVTQGVMMTSFSVLSGARGY